MPEYQNISYPQQQTQLHYEIILRNQSSKKLDFQKATFVLEGKKYNIFCGV
jgi:hypothetical protein